MLALVPLPTPPHLTEAQPLRPNLNMDWGMLVCTKGTAPCSFNTCTTTLSHSAGTPSFKLKPSVESWPWRKHKHQEDNADESGALLQPVVPSTTVILAEVRHTHGPLSRPLDLIFPLRGPNDPGHRIGCKDRG